MSKNPLLNEIAALQAKVDGIQKEIDSLRRRLDSTPPRKMTQSFGSTAPEAEAEATPSDQPPVVDRSSSQPRPRTLTDAPMAAPPAPPRSEVPPRTKRSIPPPSSVPSPSPSIPASSQVVAVARRAASAHLDLEPTPSTRITPSRRNALNNPDAGRYEYVGEGSGKSRRR